MPSIVRRSLRAHASAVVGASLVLALILPGGAAVAASGAQLELAVEAPAEGEPLPGPEPVLEHEENQFAPEPYERPWTWGLGVILTVVAVLAIVATVLGWLRLRRVEQRERSGGSAGR